MDNILYTLVTKQILREYSRLLLLLWCPLMNHTSKYLCLCLAPYHNISELGHEITFVQWDISKHDTSRGLISICTLKSGTLLLRTQLPCCEEAQAAMWRGPDKEEPRLPANNAS